MVDKITNIKIIERFVYDYGRKYYLRELASVLKRPHQTIKPYVEELVKQGILIKTKRKNLVEYALNLKTKEIDDYLVIAEKQRLLERLDKDIIIKVLFERLSDLFTEDTFIIFGSSVEEVKKGSDLDLLVIGRYKVDKILEEFEEVYNKKIHKVQVDNLSKLSNTLIKEIYKKHLILNNTEQIINFFRNQYQENLAFTTP